MDKYKNKPKVKSINPMQDDLEEIGPGAASAAYGGAVRSAFKIIEKKFDDFAVKEIAKMNSPKIMDQLSAWSKPGVVGIGLSITSPEVEVNARKRKQTLLTKDKIIKR